jgi:thymidylate synthase
MIKADKYLKETIFKIFEYGELDKDPRPKWSDGTPAHTKFITQEVFSYDISKGEFPINTLRTTALKGAFHDIEAIYINQTNIVEEMHPSIQNWWRDAIVQAEQNNQGELVGSLGNTYGHTIARYGLIDRLLYGLVHNPYGRRHSINMNQEQQTKDNPSSLPPCAYETLYSVRGEFIDMTLIQRSQDYVATASINPAQYVTLGMMICNHLEFKTGIKYQIGKFLHIVQNCHIYDRHFEVAKELFYREPTGLQPKIELICGPKNFYRHTVDDFKFSGLEGIEGLDNKLEIAK